jgi:hypothetical protein
MEFIRESVGKVHRLSDHRRQEFSEGELKRRGLGAAEPRNSRAGYDIAGQTQPKQTGGQDSILVFFLRLVTLVIYRFTA